MRLAHRERHADAQATPRRAPAARPTTTTARKTALRPARKGVPDTFRPRRPLGPHDDEDQDDPMKTCTKCGETKPLDAFHRDQRKPDGRQAQCKNCRNAGTAAYQRAYRTANAEAISERDRAYRAANRVAIAEYRRAYRAANREILADQMRTYRQEKRHVAWARTYRARARRYGLEPVVESFTYADVIARYGDACAHCGGTFDELDHYPTPVIEGGPHALDNVRPACTPCNRGRVQTAA
ncbi:hypothetical protein BHQ21_11600 [Mycobacterium sherrisii]|uniref:HNH nuclease domain-containing protein n=1 Tax=Mycobacterium sherrisii TaxID=243061 RepID=A0A1E3SWA3_9MYCO|nr:hypothetical protein BHQ21_11600 [Mycobacterium sherrisii]